MSKMKLVINKRALNDYTIQDTYLAGVVLTGAEVKSLRLGHASLTGSYVKVIANEVFLVGAQISPYKYADNRDYDPKRTRKLLMRRRQIDDAQASQDEKGLTLVPLAWEKVGRHIKISVGLARGKKQHEKRAELRRRSIERDVAREVKHHTSYRV